MRNAIITCWRAISPSRRSSACRLWRHNNPPLTAAASKHSRGNTLPPEHLNVPPCLVLALDRFRDPQLQPRRRRPLLECLAKLPLKLCLNPGELFRLVFALKLHE